MHIAHMFVKKTYVGLLVCIAPSKQRLWTAAKKISLLCFLPEALCARAV